MSADRTVGQAYQIVFWRGKRADRRTIAATEWAERWLSRKLGAKIRLQLEFQIAQGSYNTGVGASAGTHDGGGVLDFRVSYWTKNGKSVPMSVRDRKWMIRALKKAGFCIWFRAAIAGLWGAHAHGVLRGHRNLAYAAAQQVLAFDARRDGLRGNRPDLTYRPKPKVRFSYVQDKPVAA